MVDALARALGHAPPFTVAECESFDGALAVSGARDLSVLGKLRSLKRLEVFRSNLQELTAVASMRGLESLRIIACPVTNLDPLGNLPRLEELEVTFTLVEDAAPIFTLPALHRLRLFGNPLTQASYKQVRSGPTPAPSGRRSPAIQVSGSDEWERGRKLHERGIALCFARVDHWAPLLVKPGADCAAWWSSVGGLDSILENAAATTETILALPWQRSPPPSLPSAPPPSAGLVTSPYPMSLATSAGAPSGGAATSMAATSGAASTRAASGPVELELPHPANEQIAATINGTTRCGRSKNRTERVILRSTLPKARRCPWGNRRRVICRLPG